MEPKMYFENDVKLLYPKDQQAGGTWIISKEDGTCIVLLNGAFVNHQKKEHYSKSRGIVLKDTIKAEDPIFYFSEISLKEIEPFTLIVIYNSKLTEVKWDGTKKHIIPKSILEPHFWSSATLYNENQQQIRSSWFQDFYRANTILTANEILSFHGNTHPENTEFGLVINREDQTKTVSITQLIVKNNRLEMTYLDRIKEITIASITF
jgi:hypothetical protein